MWMIQDPAPETKEDLKGREHTSAERKPVHRPWC